MDLIVKTNKNTEQTQTNFKTFSRVLNLNKFLNIYTPFKILPPLYHIYIFLFKLGNKIIRFLYEYHCLYDIIY